MIAATDWTNLTVAGAFVLGAVVASFATIRIVRALSTMFADLEDRRRGGASTARGGASTHREDPAGDDGSST